jgi:N-acetylglucosamine-6-phosphate deacetylase
MIFCSRTALKLAVLLSLTTGARALAAQETSTAPANGLRDRTPTAHALTGAKIVIAPGQVIERGTIVVRDGMIVDVGEKVECPADCRVWDFSGKTIYPGLIESYSALPGSDSSAARGPAYWNPNVVPQLAAEELFKPDEALNAKLRGQGITLRIIVPATGIIRGTSAAVTTADDAPSRVLVKDRVALHLEPTLRSGRERNVYPNSPMGAMALVRQALYDARWYQKAWDTYRAKDGIPRPERNAALEVLSGYIGDGMPVVIDAQDELYFLRADQLANEFGLNAIVCGSGQEYRRLDAIKATGRPMILPVDFPKAPNVATPEAAAAASLEDLLDWDLAPENPGRLEQGGVRFAITSHGLKDASEFLTAVRRAVERGLSRDAALRALTTTPAELFGLSDRFGTIERGKAAHLVIASGDLFAKGTKISETWVDGQRFEPAATPRFDLRGTWDVAMTTEDGQALKLELKLSGEPSKLSGTIRQPVEAKNEAAKHEDAAQEKDDAKTKGNGPQTDEKNAASKDEVQKDEPQEKKREAKLTRAALSDVLFTATFPGEPFQFKGIVQLSATVIAGGKSETANDSAHAGTAGKGLEMLGHVVWADGQRAPLFAQRVKELEPSGADSTRPEKSADEQSDAAAAAELAAKEQPDEVSEREGTETKVEAPHEVPPEDKVASDQEPLAEKVAASKAKPKVQIAALYPVNYPLGAFGVAAPPEQPAHVLFTNATVWTSGPAGVLEGASVLVSAGKITAVGTDVTVPEGAVVVDCTGKHIAPGIIDCHSHIATDGGVNESGQAITAEVRIGDFIDPNDVNIYRQLAGGVTAANILHGSANPIGGQNQVVKMRWGALPEELKFAGAPAGIKFALGENVKQSNWGANFTTRYPQTRMGVEQIVRDEFAAAREYRRRHDEWKKSPTGLPPRIDLELEAVAEILEGKRLIHCHSYRQDEILAFMRVCEDYGVRIATLQHILEGYKLADVMRQHGAGGSSFSDWWAYKFEVFDAIPYNGALMHNAGVTVSFNSDDAELARRLNLEAAKAVKYGGIEPAEALKFVTLNPAKQLRIDDRVGSLEAGKDADLVVWSGSPLSVYSHCEQTWVDGRKYFDRQVDRERRETVNKMRRDLVQKILITGAEMAGQGEERSAQRTLWPREDLFCHGHDGHDHLHEHIHAEGH